jgi:hypothetical protein
MKAENLLRSIRLKETGAGIGENNSFTIEDRGEQPSLFPPEN